MTFKQAVADTLRDWYCSASQANTDLFWWLYDAWTRGEEETDLDLQLVSPFLGYERALALWVCNRNPETEALAPSPPFLGGQCIVNYSVKITIKYRRDEFPSDPLREDIYYGTYIGKLLGINIIQAVTDLPNNEAYCQVVYNSGNSVQNLFVSRIFQDAAFWNVRIVSASIENLGRTDGLADSCGDLPIPKEDKPTIPIVRDIDYEDEDGQPVNLPNTNIVIFRPNINIDGSLEFEFELPDLSFTGIVNIKDSFNVYIKPSIDIERKGRDGDDGTGSGDDNPEPDLFEEHDPEDEKDIIGVWVNSQKKTDKYRQSIIGQDKSPDIIIPRIGTVSFLVRTGNRQGWTEDIPIKSVNAYIPCPHFEGARDVAVNWDDQWKGKYYPHKGSRKLDDD